MKMKYFQSIAEILNHYDEILQRFDKIPWGHMLLDTWGIKVTEKEREKLIEEREVLRYLIGCELMLVNDENGENAKKPSLHVVQRCFQRHLDFLEKIHRCHAYNVNKHPNVKTRKEYKACRYYLFKFSLSAWYEKLPNEILTFQNKYGSA
ncbi:hypothetical protein SMD22_00860 (plasmid) [Brevibacillus halotolerans]|nr:hypothetical protein SMD22_00860 [Brevibacillus halotolerans]